MSASFFMPMMYGRCESSTAVSTGSIGCVIVHSSSGMSLTPSIWSK